MDQGKVATDVSDVDQEKFIEDLKDIILDAASRCRNCNYCFN